MEEQPTTNIQHPTSNGRNFRSHWLLGVRCWRLNVSRVHKQGDLHRPSPHPAWAEKVPPVKREPSDPATGELFAHDRRATLGNPADYFLNFRM